MPPIGENGRASRVNIDVTHVFLSILFLTVLVSATFWVLSPFLTSILWATIVSVATWPILLRLQSALGGRRGLAVAIMTTVILLVVFVPVILAVGTIVGNADNVTTGIKTLETIALPPPPAWLARLPIAGPRLATKWASFAELDAAARIAVLTPYMQSALQWFAAKAGSVGTMLLQFLLTTIVTAILMAKGELVRDSCFRFAERLGGQKGHDVAVLAAQTIRSVVLGVVLTALIQSAIGGTGLVVSGVPAAGLLTAVMFFLCLAQLGPLLVMLPAVGWLYWSGQNGVATVLLVISLVAGTLDNFVRPLLIKRGADLPLLLIFAGVLGGLLAFGVIGLFLGPVVLTVGHTLLAAWVSSGKLPADPVAEAGTSIDVVL
ncbi:MAG TPA: AI-2E family transporter YdiK [Vicinamibacterales bacterium]|jgi:predicted PurR-regulated permease PerM